MAIRINPIFALLGILPSIMCLQSSALADEQEQFQFYFDPDRMEQEIADFIPVGTPIQEAELIMEANGFQCEYQENENFSRVRDDNDSPSRLRIDSYENIDYLYCDFSRVIWIEERWQVALLDENDVVTFIAVSTGIAAP